MNVVFFADAHWHPTSQAQNLSPTPTHNKLARGNEEYNTHAEQHNGSIGHRYIKLRVAGESIRTMTFASECKTMQPQQSRLHDILYKLQPIQTKKKHIYIYIYGKR